MSLPSLPSLPSHTVGTIDNPPPIPEGHLKNIIEALIEYKKPFINKNTLTTQDPDAITEIKHNFTKDVVDIKYAILRGKIPDNLEISLKNLINILLDNSNDPSMKTLVPYYCDLILLQYTTALDPNQVERMVKAANAK